MRSGSLRAAVSGWLAQSASGLAFATPSAPFLAFESAAHRPELCLGLGELGVRL
jgi:hypothetical protein